MCVVFCLVLYVYRPCRTYRSWINLISIVQRCPQESVVTRDRYWNGLWRLQVENRKWNETSSELSKTSFCTMHITFDFSQLTSIHPCKSANRILISRPVKSQSKAINNFRNSILKNHIAINTFSGCSKCEWERNGERNEVNFEQNVSTSKHIRWNTRFGSISKMHF